MSRTQRRRRVVCKLPCQIEISATEKISGRVVALSEGGLAVLSGRALEQGDSIELLIHSGGPMPIRVSAIVWNEQRTQVGKGGAHVHRLGCVISSPSDGFTGLLERTLPAVSVEARNHRVRKVPASTPVAPPRPRDGEVEWEQPDLPRSRELLPPPKVEPEESLPYFRVRLKQIGSPRTRIMTVRARSATQAEERAFEEFTQRSQDAEGWGVIHVAKVLRAL